MGFKQRSLRAARRRSVSQLPEVNLVPMMDVLMTVLTFFVIISMTLSSGQRIVGIPLPLVRQGAGSEAMNQTNPLEVGLNRQGQILVDNRPIPPAQLTQTLQEYLLNNPEGAIVLKADRKLPYQQVVQLLQTMREVGGDRVSLAIAQN